MNFASDFPEKLCSNLLLSEVVSRKVSLKQRGKEFIGLCPFHNEKSPSFTVSNQKGFYHCFGCQASGDAITFKMRSEGLEFKEAVIELANEFGINIPVVANYQDKAKIEQFDKNLKIAAKINDFFTKNLLQPSASEARQYLKNRGIETKIIEKFGLGFAANSYEALTKFLQNEGFSDEAIASCGVIGKNDRNQLYDKFRNRITFPISDSKGKVIAFGGRTIADDLPKYLNSAETEIFKKNQTVYNLANARSDIFSKGYAILVEGYMDVVSLDIFGIENAVAGLGTAVSSEQLNQLFRITDKIIICLDGDAAGFKAAKRVAELSLPLINSKKNLAFTLLPQQLDPDDFLKTFGANEFKKLLKEAKSLSQFLLETTSEEVCASLKLQITAEEKAKIATILEEKTKQIIDENSKKFFAQFFKDSLYFLGRKNEKYKKIPQKHFGLNSSQNMTKILLPAMQNKAMNLGLAIIAFLIKFPWLVDYCDESFDLRNCHLANQEIESLKDFVVSLIDNSHDEQMLEVIKSDSVNANSASANNLVKAILSGLEMSEFASYLQRLQALIYGHGLGNLLSNNSSNKSSIQHQAKMIDELALKQKFKLMLLKDLHLQLEQQYQDSLTKIDSIETEQTTISSQNITEIFNHKNSLETLILKLEQEGENF